MFEWLKAHKKLIMVISVLIIFGVPLIIHILFKIEAPNSFFVAEWSAGELLSYYGSILAFIGTVFPINIFYSCIRNFSIVSKSYYKN